MWKGQQLTEGQRDEADASGSGWRSAGHQLQQLLGLLICRSAEGSSTFTSGFREREWSFSAPLDRPEPSDPHQSAVESEQSAGLHHVLLPEARVPRAAFHVAVVGDVRAARARQDGDQLQQQLPPHLPQHRAALSLSLGDAEEKHVNVGRRNANNRLWRVREDRRTSVQFSQYSVG